MVRSVTRFEYRSDWTCDQIQLALEYRPPIGRMIGSSQSFEDKERREEGSDQVTALSIESSVSGPRTLVIKTSQTLHREPTKRVTIATVTSQHRSVESDGTLVRIGGSFLSSLSSTIVHRKCLWGLRVASSHLGTTVFHSTT